MIENYIAFIWLVLIAFFVIMYVICDGLDLGTGILFPLIKKQSHRDIMMSSILPVWDGNQTWLVLGGASLYGAFPLAFSTLLPILYAPLFLMLTALLFRGITFEFRLKAKTSINRWDRLFFIGSIVTAFVQGIVLGTYVQGFNVVNGVVEFSYLSWFTPFSFITGLGEIFGYALLGVGWLIAKTEADLQRKFFKIASKLLPIVLVFLILVSLWTPLVNEKTKLFWFDPDNFYRLASLPIATFVLLVGLWWSLRKQNEFAPFWLTIGIFICAYAGFLINSWPYLVPHQITYWQAAAPRNTLQFMLVGVVIMLPILLYYTCSAYYIFRGKVREVFKY